MTEPERNLVSAAVAVLNLAGSKPSVRLIDGVIKAANGGKGLRWATISEALKTLPGNSTGNSADTAGQRFYEERATDGQQTGNTTRTHDDAPARIDVLLNQELNSQESSPPVSPPSPVAPAQQPERPMATVHSLFPDLPATPAAGKKAPAKRVTIASQDANADFGEFEPHVREVLAVEAGLRADGKISERMLLDLRRRLAYWRRTYGDDAFANGLRVGIESGKGVAYGGGAMRRFDPEREGAPATGGGWSGAREQVDADFEALPSVANGGLAGTPASEIPPWERNPNHPLYEPYDPNHPLAQRAFA